MSTGKIEKVYKITPIPKPRMTQRDKWKKRPCVLRYFAFKDEVRLNNIVIPEQGAHITFYIAMPKSWPKKKKVLMEGQPHQQKPDLDNYAKSILDAVFDDDAKVWDLRVTKLWAYEDSIRLAHTPVGQTGG